MIKSIDFLHLQPKMNNFLNKVSFHTLTILIGTNLILTACLKGQALCSVLGTCKYLNNTVEDQIPPVKIRTG